jgi:hypothetical protein
MGMKPEELGMIKSPDLKGVPPFTPVKPILTKIGEST